METMELPLGLTEWARVERIEKTAEYGRAFWQTQQFGDLRVRIMEYTRVTCRIIGARKVTCCCASKVSLLPN